MPEVEAAEGVEDAAAPAPEELTSAKAPAPAAEAVDDMIDPDWVKKVDEAQALLGRLRKTGRGGGAAATELIREHLDPDREFIDQDESAIEAMVDGVMAAIQRIKTERHKGKPAAKEGELFDGGQA